MRRLPPIAALLAREKARKVAVKLPGRVVLGADQILALDGRRFSKPRDRAGVVRGLADRASGHDSEIASLVEKLNR